MRTEVTGDIGHPAYLQSQIQINFTAMPAVKTWGAYHLTEKSGWGVESKMVSDLPIYLRNATSVTV